MNRTRKGAAIVFGILSVLCMGIIFYFSSCTGDESARQSNFVVSFMAKILFFLEPSSFIVRKSAHFLEYMGLCLMLNFHLYFLKGKKMMFSATAIASLYSVTDEIHQIFVEGRSCQFTDWVVDTCGAITGTFAFLLIIIIYEKLRRKINNECFSF